MIRRIRDLLYDQGFTISGARNKLQEMVQSDRERRTAGLESPIEGVEAVEIDLEEFDAAVEDEKVVPPQPVRTGSRRSPRSPRSQRPWPASPG